MGLEGLEGVGGVPMGSETPTKVPLFRAGPTSSTKLPRRMPISMARKIQSARNRSRKPRDLKTESRPSALAWASPSWSFNREQGGSCCWPSISALVFSDILVSFSEGLLVASCPPEGAVTEAMVWLLTSLSRGGGDGNVETKAKKKHDIPTRLRCLQCWQVLRSVLNGRR